MHLAAAGNTVIPAIQVLKKLGYTVSTTWEGGNQLFVAGRDNNTFIGGDPVMVLGLIKLYEVKGENWRVSDAELETIGREYGLLG